MKKHGSIITAMLVACMLLFDSYGAMAGQHNYTSIEKAAKEGQVLLNISGNGSGHMGYCLNMTICNRGNTPCYCALEAGRRLHSEDTSIQDIVVVQGENLELAAKQTRTIKVYGFCCQRYNSAPDEHSRYTIGRMANGTLYAVATFLSRHTNYRLTIMQSAIWTMSDNVPFTSIESLPGEDLQPLLDTLTNIKRQSKSWFRLVSRSGKKRVECDLAYNLPGQSIVTISVYDPQGNKVTTCYEQLSTPDDYITPVSLNADGWKKGSYTICVMSDANILLKKSFVL